jgi:predicted deacylase
MYPIEYIPHGRVRATPEFLQWFAGLRDRTVQRRIARRLDRLTAGNLGDWKDRTCEICASLHCHWHHARHAAARVSDRAV